MTRSLILVASVAALAACSPGKPEETEAKDVAASVSRTDDHSESGRAFAYTALSDCKTIIEEREEGQYLEQDCPGLGGYMLKASVGDLRANLEVIPPGGKATSLDLTRIGGGGFSALGETFEWRGPTGDSLAPDSLIVRYNVVEQPETNKEVSYLLVTRLAPTPCVIGKVPPGAGQNARARDLADAGGDCLAG